MTDESEKKTGSQKMKDIEEKELPRQISWQTKEFQYYEKSPRWFYIGGIITSILVIGFVLSESYIPAITFFLCMIVIFIFASRKPKDIEITLNSQGAWINNELFPYREIKSFWFNYNPPFVKTLNIDRKNPFVPDLTLELSDENPLTIRKYLLQYLKEDPDREERFVDKLSRLIRF